MPAADPGSALAARAPHPYYGPRLASLRDIFGTEDVVVAADAILVDGSRHPIIDDVIVLLPPELRPRALGGEQPAESEAFAPDIQHTFGEEWKTFSTMLPDHERLFRQYFDLVDLGALQEKRVADLGCGMGRWSHFMAPRCRELVLVDFSEAIFVARKNLQDRPNALFFMADVHSLPFRPDFADFAFSLGVLHHLPTPVLDNVRRLRPFAPELLVYLYYALDNRPRHYRWLLRVVDAVRRRTNRIEGTRARAAFTWAIALLVYRPLVGLGWLLWPIGLSRHVPLHEGYKGKSLRLIRQDVYDRFFTRIEQRVTREQVAQLRDAFSSVHIADTFPYWHFLLRR